MRQQLIARCRARLELAFIEKDVLPVGEGGGIDIFGSAGSLSTGVHAHAGKVGSEGLLHRATC